MAHPEPAEPAPPARSAPARDRASALAFVRALGRALGALSRPVAAAAALAWMALIWGLSSGPLPPLGPAGLSDFTGNLAHAPAFGVLAALAAAALARRPLPARSPGPGRVAALAAFALTVAWSVTDEWHQSRVPGRHASPFDALTDATGAACTLWIALYAGRPDAHERGMRRRLVLALGGCLLAAGVATAADALR
jgi:hypothetical protein